MEVQIWEVEDNGNGVNVNTQSSRVGGTEVEEEGFCTTTPGHLREREGRILSSSVLRLKCSRLSQRKRAISCAFDELEVEIRRGYQSQCLQGRNLPRYLQ